MSQQGREKMIPNSSEKLEKGVINPKSDEIRADLLICGRKN